MNIQFDLNTNVHKENNLVVKIPIHNAQTQLIAEDIQDEEIPLIGDNTKTIVPVTVDEKTSQSDEDILEVFDGIDETGFKPKTLAPLHKNILIKTENENSKTSSKSSVSLSNSKIHVSENESDDEVICVEEIDGHAIESFESQPLILPETAPSDKDNNEPMFLLRQENRHSPIIDVKRSNMTLDPDSFTDCEDIGISPTEDIIDQKVDDIHYEEDKVKVAKKSENSKVTFDEMDEMTLTLEEDYRENSPILQHPNLKKGSNNNTVGVNESRETSKVDHEIILCPDEECEIQDRFRHIEHMSLKGLLEITETSLCDDEKKEEVNEYDSSLSIKQIKDVVDVNESTSDLSDIEVAPKKINRFIFMNALLPDDQEIKVSVAIGTRLDISESSSESEADPDSQVYTPILFKKKFRTKKEAKVDLTKKFDADTLPTRVIGRVRKAPAKLMQDSKTKHLITKMLKPRFLTELEDNIDTEIITENILRLKNYKKQKIGTNKLTATEHDIKTHSNKTKEDNTRGKEAKKSKIDSPIKNTSTDELDILKYNENSQSKVPKKQSVDNYKVASNSNSKKNSKASAEKVKLELQRRTNIKSHEIEIKNGTDKLKHKIKSTENVESSLCASTRRKNTSDNPKKKNTKEKPRNKDKRKSNEKASEKPSNTKRSSITKGILEKNTTEKIVNLEYDQEDPKITIARPIRNTRGRIKIEKLFATSEPHSKSPVVRARPPSKRDKKSHSTPVIIRRSRRQKITHFQNDSKTTETTKKITCKKTVSKTKLKSLVTTSKNAESQNKAIHTKASRKRKLTDTRGKKSHSLLAENAPELPIRRSRREKSANSQNDTKMTNFNTKTSNKTDSRSKITLFVTTSSKNVDSQNPKETWKRKLTDPKQNQGTVYNISAESNPDSPAGIKRAASEVKRPSPKRIRSANSKTATKMLLRSMALGIRTRKAVSKKI